MARGRFLDICLVILGLFEALKCQESYVSLTSLGCWRDHQYHIIPSLEGKSAILDGYYRSRTDAVQKCARAAIELGSRVFAVQNGGWCGSSILAESKYQKMGRSTNCGNAGKGGFRASDVYRIDGTRSRHSRPHTVEPHYVFNDGTVVRPNRQRPRRPSYGISTSSGNRLVGISSAKIVPESTPRTDQPSFHAFILNDLGCWAIPVEGIRSLEGDLPDLDGHFRYRTKAVQKCARAAGTFGFFVIAMHNGGKCMAITDVDVLYKSNEKRSSCSYTGKGSYNAIQVYEIRYSKTRNPPPPLTEATTTAAPATTTTRRTYYQRPGYIQPTSRPETVQPDIQLSGDSYNGEYIHVTNLGCWNYAWNDTLPTMEGSSDTLDGHYSQRVSSVQKCAKVAVEFGYEIFAIQDGGRCVSSPDARLNYARLGLSTYCRQDGKGGSWVNQVYEVNIVWEVRLTGLGCFVAGHTNTIESLEATTGQLDGDHYRRENAVRKCAMAAASRGFQVFALHDDGKCLADEDAVENYDRWGKAGTCNTRGGGGQDSIEVYDTLVATKLKLENLGCWKDKAVRAVPGMERTDGDLMDNYKIRKDAIGKCARAAHRSGFTVFVIQDGGWCGGSFTSGDTYSTYGRSDLCRDDGEGGYQANQVYSIEEE